MNGNAKKRFHIGDVLSITTGCLVSRNHIDGVYAILGHMTGEQLMTHQLPRAADEARPYLQDQVPELFGLVVPEFDGEESVHRWVDDQAHFYGEWFDIAPIPRIARAPHDPLTELVDLMGPRPAAAQ